MTNHAGIDLSLAETGLSAIDEDGRCVDGKIIKISLRGAARLHGIVEETIAFLRQHSPDSIAIEGYILAGKFVHTIGKLAELHGALKETLYGYLGPYSDVDVFGVAPTVLKKYITGSGKAEKSDVKLSIYKKYGLTYTNNNMADAYALARIARRAVMDEPPPHKYQVECLKAISRSY